MPMPPRNESDEPERGPTDPELAMVRAIAYRAALRAGATRADAEEIAQIVVMRLWLKWWEDHLVTARARGTRAWRAYVAKSARNALKDLRRSNYRRHRRQIKTLPPSQRLPLPARPGVVGPPPPSPSATDEYLARLEIVDVVDNELTGRQWMVARLLFVHGWSVRRIAVALQKSERTIRADRAAAAARIRAALQRIQGS